MRTIKVTVCAILTANRKSPESFIEKFVSDLYFQLEQLPGVLGQVILSIESDGREDWLVLDKLKKTFPNLLINAHSSVETKNASLYTEAFKLALAEGADLVVEIDAAGAHDANVLAHLTAEAAKIVQENAKALICVMSTRMSGGGADLFPFGRVFISKAGTLFAHFALMLGAQGRNLTDFTSGYTVYSAPLLSKMQATLPFEEWVSIVKGPLHLFQTEIRAFVCWISKYTKVRIIQIPIIYGANLGRKPGAFSFNYLLRALLGGLLLIWEGLIINLKLS